MSQTFGLTQPTPKRPRELGESSPFLIVFHGGIPGTLHPLIPPQMQLGRAATNALRLSDDTVSRSHAAFELREDRSVWLMDLGSSAGTFLNGARLTPREPRRLAPGDRLQFGMRAILKYEELNELEEQAQREQFRRMVCDDLTGLHNRVYFLDQIDGMIERFSQDQMGMALLLLDVDRFKGINDAHGHHAGDLVLKAVGQTLRYLARTDDLVVRYGGEEFVIAAPARSLDQALILAERFRSTIALQSIEIAPGRSLQATASVGVAFAGWSRPLPYEMLLKSADLCLYQAKQNGRDRVCSERDCPLARNDASPADDRTLGHPFL